MPSFSANPPLSIGQCATLACIYEATAPKPGNVHRGADFEDLTYLDLVVSGVAIGPTMERAATQPLGRTIYDAVAATRQLVATNSNLGMILLIAPLARVPRLIELAGNGTTELRTGVRNVLANLTTDDTRLVYDAIRMAKPGGLGQVETADVHDSPPDDLIAAMRLAADRDLIARQYSNDFAELFEFVVPTIEEELRSHTLNDAIVRAFLQTMSRFPDSLITRKLGSAMALRAGDQAAEVLRAAEAGDEVFHDALAEFDFWLRSDGHRRNPGTTADMIAAGLFIVLRTGILGHSTK